MAGKSLGAITAQDEQIRLLTYTAVAAGARGLIFESRTRLDAADIQTKARAASLELLNLELALIEPWGAAGSYLSSIAGSDPQVTGAILQAERERVVLPLWMGTGSQFVPGQSAGNSISFVIPGVPEDHRAYEITPAGVKPLETRRVTGGTSATLDEFGLTSIILLTQNPVAISELSGRLARSRERAARLQRDLAYQKLRNIEEMERRLASIAPSPRQGPAWFSAARAGLEKSDLAMGAGEFEAAYLSAQRAMRPMRLIERAHWDAHSRALGPPVASPLGTSFATLPEHLQLVGRIRGGRFESSQLPGGDFERLDSMLSAGWRNLMHPQPGLETQAELTPEAARSGTLGMRLQVRSTLTSQSPALVESAPLWISSPALSTVPGAIYRIRAAVRIAAPITGSNDGLMVVDSLGGEPLAERIRTTRGWQEVTLYRVAAGTAPLAVSFVLTGLGTVDIDDVRIEPLLPAGAGRLDQVALPNTDDLRRLPVVR
ncbi:MAG: hypothetical protein HY000_12070 [Planctomycetes bacterium]|nr:hypothetical protein [Planctomycetota bacterium]